MDNPAVIVTLHLLAAAACIWIAVQDFRSREVSVLLFIGLGALGLLMMLSGDSFSFLMAFLNAVVVALMVGVVALWQIIRGRSIRAEGLGLGLGDVAFLLAAGCWLFPMTFILFLVGSFWLVLLGSLAYRKWKKLDAQWPIPLAGGQALLFIPLLALSLMANLGCHLPWVEDTTHLKLFLGRR